MKNKDNIVRILHSSFACDPHMGSEPYVGWNWAKMARDSGLEVHVITRKHHKKAIEMSGGKNGIIFHYLDLPFFEKTDHRSKVMKPYYVLWQILILPKVWVLNNKYKYGAVHHITYNSMDYPGLLWLLPRTKFIWGPVGGGQIPPVQLRRVYGKKWFLQIIRKYQKYLARYNPIVRLAIRRSNLIMFANEETENLLGELAGKSIRMLETAVDRAIIRKSEQIEPNIRKILWVGVIESRKALVMLIDVMNMLERKKAEGIQYRCTVVGDGPLKKNMEDYSRVLGLESVIEFVGKVKHAEVDNYYRHSDLFVFTSVQDTSGNVILESMARGLPVVALNHQGAKIMLSEGGGILVPISSYSDTVTNIAKSIEAVLSDTSMQIRLSSQAVDAIRTKYTWREKGKIVSEIYREILN